MGGLLSLLLAAGCGIVPSPEQEAKSHATSQVRAQATRLGTSLWAGLREVDATGARHVAEQHEEMLGPFDAEAGPWEDGVLAVSVDQRGVVRLDVAFRDKADAGGGLSAAQAVVMLCVRLTGTPGPSGEIRLVDLACPAGLVSPGVVDEVVTLAREGPPPTPEHPRDPCLSGGSNDDCAGG